MGAVFGQIEKKEKELNCYISLDREEALKQADEVQKKIEDGTLAGPLAGVPAAVKERRQRRSMRQRTTVTP